MKVTLDDNAGRVVRERALRKICELLRENNKVTDIITQYGTT
jgi:PleD family two-component response regulator